MRNGLPQGLGVLGFGLSELDSLEVVKSVESKARGVGCRAQGLGLQGYHAGAVRVSVTANNSVGSYDRLLSSPFMITVPFFPLPGLGRRIQGTQFSLGDPKANY